MENKKLKENNYARPKLFVPEQEDLKRAAQEIAKNLSPDKKVNGIRGSRKMKF